ncbi:MAG: RsmE family RNA methyltransferase [Ignavibacteria bacterium]|jgi:16S rRNA (uracil1498-N3)-methyltransferase
MEEHNLSHSELYYSPFDNVLNDTITLTGDEYKHSAKVMRNKIGDIIRITDGMGQIFKAKISSVDREILTAKIKETVSYSNKSAHLYFCIPKLKSPDRFKFALEKCVELGVTNFLIFEAERSVAKGTNLKRWEKIILSAMKQSLRAYLPKVQIQKDLLSISELPGNKIIFEQTSQNVFHFNLTKESTYFFIFGPEGGLTEDELNLFDRDSIYSLSTHRLRSETAMIKAASLLSKVFF